MRWRSNCTAHTYRVVSCLRSRSTGKPMESGDEGCCNSLQPQTPMHFRNTAMPVHYQLAYGVCTVAEDQTLDAAPFPLHGTPPHPGEHVNQASCGAGAGSSSTLKGLKPCHTGAHANQASVLRAAVGRCISVHASAASCRPATNTSATVEALAAPAPTTVPFCAVSIAVANASARPSATCACRTHCGSVKERSRERHENVIHRMRR